MFVSTHRWVLVSNMWIFYSNRRMFVLTNRWVFVSNRWREREEGREENKEDEKKKEKKEEYEKGQMGAESPSLGAPKFIRRI